MFGWLRRLLRVEHVVHITAEVKLSGDKLHISAASGESPDKPTSAERLSSDQQGYSGSTPSEIITDEDRLDEISKKFKDIKTPKVQFGQTADSQDT